MHSAHTYIAAVLALAVSTSGGHAQQGKIGPKVREHVPATLVSNLDRALGIHSRSNIGHAFQNRGKMYPVRSYYDLGIVSGEFPRGSRREYIYNMNPMVGIPGNVIQSRWVTNAEWEAASGYHNRDTARVATSDKPSTWPATGWPVRDALGNPRFVSDQDTYCVYNDSTNTKEMLSLQVNQTGYAFIADQFKNMVFFTYQIVNKSSRTYDSLYFGLYVDIDVGDVLGSGAQEYVDDKANFIKSLDLLYFYDDGYTPDWPGNQTGYFGVTVIATPPVGGVEPSVTDFHYNLYEDDLDADTVQYGILSSARSLYESPMGPKYFHLGSNAPDLHFDDSATIPPAGLDLVATLGSGPYSIAPGDTLAFVTAFVAGNTYEEIIQSTQSAHDLARGGFVVAAGHGDASVPVSCRLFQNYPNPFNPSTVIGYTVGGVRGQGLGVSNVRLAVYDILGREVVVLVNERKAPGTYNVDFDATGLASGVYFYRLTVGEYVECRKMVLMK